MLKEQASGDKKTTAKQPAHQSVYRRLRTGILFGDLAPGQAVTIKGLTEELAAGMTPVREAIRRLTSEGALSMLGNRRVIVPELTENCIEQLDFMRQSLEPELGRRAAQRMTAEILAELKDIDDTLNQAISQGDIKGYLTHNYRFHARLYASADAPVLADTTDRLWLKFGPSLRVVCGRYGTLNLPDKHAEMLSALETGDAEGTARALAEDVHQGMLQVREALQAARS